MIKNATVGGYVNGVLTVARFKWAKTLVAIGTDLYVGDHKGYILRKIDTGAATPEVNTVAGSNVIVSGHEDHTTGTSAEFGIIRSMTTDGSKFIFMVGYDNKVVRKVDISDNYATSTILGNKDEETDSFTTVADTTMLYPRGIVFNKTGLYVFSNKSILKMH